MKYYSGIDELPMYNWNQVHKTGDLTYLLIDRSKTKGIKFDVLLDTWNKLYDEYIAKFGFDKQYLAILQKELEIAELIIEKAETDNETLGAIIEIEKQKAQKLKEQNAKGGDFYESKAMLERQLGFVIDIRKCSVVEFYSYIKSIEKQNRN